MKNEKITFKYQIGERLPFLGNVKIIKRRYDEKAGEAYYVILRSDNLTSGYYESQLENLRKYNDWIDVLIFPG